MKNNRVIKHCILDRIRINDGNDKCKSVFRETLEKNKWEALTLLNDRRMTFPGLYLLLPEIESRSLVQHLNHHNTMVFKIINQIIKPLDQNEDDYLSVKSNSAYPVLKWILETGYKEDGLNDEYEKILEVIVSVLINVYQDKGILPVVADMLFKRNKTEHYIHDLVWALFRITDPVSLRLIAERIRSSEQKDIELACNLLNIEASEMPDNQKQYDSYLQWLEENDAFLYFTGESLQFASKPVFCNIDHERKYLNKGNMSYKLEPVTPSDETEFKCLEAFRSLNDEEKKTLSGYSYEIHNKNINEWEKWMHSPIGEQLTAAVNKPEVLI